MRLYSDLAAWWPLFSPPSHYVEEAAHLLSLIRSESERAPRTLLELGSGGGSLAHHLKHHMELTLTDVSPDMLAVSRRVNPGVEHLLGDMRAMRLGRAFDAVLVHDAIMHALTAEAVVATLSTAWEHCRPGGTVFVLPDYVSESYTPTTASGGEDGPDGRGLRYLEWTWDPDPADTTSEAAFAFLLREADGAVRVESDRHRFGLFPRRAWKQMFETVGFVHAAVTDQWQRDVMIGRRPADGR